MKNAARFLLDHKCFEIEGALPEGVPEKISESEPSLYHRSAFSSGKNIYMLRKTRRGRRIIAFAPEGAEPGPGLKGDDFKIETAGGNVFLKDCPADHENISALRGLLSHMRPATLGLSTSFGMGDRLGIATPGHIRASRGYDFSPVFPQQSIREMERTGRTPDEVMDDACLGVFQEGFDRPFGADADHLKTGDDVRSTSAAGFTFFTIDPSDHLVQEADSMSAGQLKEAFSGLFSEGSGGELMKRYADRKINVPRAGGSDAVFEFSDESLMRTAVKYLPAVRHTAKMYELLCELLGEGNFDLEMSVDETSAPTTTHEHLFVASELRHMDIAPQSLAPRYVGEFQKGIDYIGDIEKLRSELELHAAIARHYGPYKLSIHSGSDKFSIFPLFGELTGGLFHEKTAGTSYLEAMRVVARFNPDLYREIHNFALARFEQDRASYHVTTDLGKIPEVNGLPQNEIEKLLDQNDARQLIHITYGSVLTETDGTGAPLFYDRIMDVLYEHEEEHYSGLAYHFGRHIESLGIEAL